jgi:hypothetical protein
MSSLVNIRMGHLGAAKYSVLNAEQATSLRNQAGHPLASRAAEEPVAPRENIFICRDAVIVAIHKKVN